METNLIWRRIAARRESIGAVLLRGGGLVVVAASAVAAARLLQPQDYGAYTTATAFTAIAAAGIGAGHTERAIRSGASPERDDPVGARAAAIVRPLLKYAPIWAAVLFPIALLTRVSVLTIAIVGIPIAVLVALTHTLEGFARGYYQQFRDLIPIQLVGPLAVLAGCGVAIALDLDVGPTGLLTWRLVLLIGTASYFAIRLAIVTRSSWSGRALAPIENLRWFAAAKLLFVLQLQSSILIAGLMSRQDAGRYAAAFRSAEPIQVGATAAALLIGPVAATAVQSGRLSSIGPTIRQHTRLGAAIAIPPTLLILAFPQFVLGLFGDEYLGAETPLRILVIAPLVTTLFGPAMIFASMIRLQRDIVVAMASAVLLQFVVAASLLAADALTLTRVALLDVAGTVLWNVVLWQRCRHAVAMTTAIV
jgi:O-antigen/teichoic acid export membrane protein